MKGDPRIIKHLNAILTNELTAINQYFLHARILKNWGLLRLAKKIYEESIGEMKHADLMVERVLFLEGLPNLQDLHKLNIGEDLPEMFTSDLALETKNRTDLLAAIADCESTRDYQSREIFETVLEDTEEHIDWLETQLDLIKRIGLQAYQQEQLYEG
jgi:bacterioferritin